jgi:hypothetical protein
MDCAASWIDHLSPDLWQSLYRLLRGINDLWVTNESSLPQDYSSVPISTFIQPGSKSAVLIRIPDYAPLPVQTINGQSNALNKTLPLSAFVQNSRLPFDGSYSDTNDPTFLATDQITKLQRFRAFSERPIHRSTWTITPSLGALLNIFTPSVSIIGEAVYAHRVLFSKLWPAMSKSTYPNLIEVDNVHNSQITALCMAINDHFASGGLGIVNQRQQRVKWSVTADVVVSITPTPTVTRDQNANMTAALPTLTPAVLRIRGRDVGGKE